MKSKMLEIRDIGTTIAVIAIKTEGETPEEHMFFRRSGFGQASIILIKINSYTEAAHDPFKWGSRRTMTTAHQYIEDNFDSIPDKSVIDVEFILGETKQPKTSEIWR